ncbi:hypothetical protein GE09DRAFT_499176 [Coniochaeta sp. 2T2.1]|nr:hypothetical protein GE09DRAFT_499176 [Coniochaeta sp. 2T2.1]
MRYFAAGKSRLQKYLLGCSVFRHVQKMHAGNSHREYLYRTTTLPLGSCPAIADQGSFCLWCVRCFPSRLLPWLPFFPQEHDEFHISLHSVRVSCLFNNHPRHSEKRRPFFLPSLSLLLFRVPFETQFVVLVCSYIPSSRPSSCDFKHLFAAFSAAIPLSVCNTLLACSLCPGISYSLDKFPRLPFGPSTSRPLSVYPHCKALVRRKTTSELFLLRSIRIPSSSCTLYL